MAGETECEPARLTAYEVPAVNRISARLLTLAIVAWASGCATPPPKAPGVQHAVAPSEAGLVCQSERVTGSLIATRVCTLQAQREARHKSAQDMRDFLDKQVTAACPGTPRCKP